MVWAIKHFQVYLYGHRCTIYTDHKTRKFFLNTSQPSGKLAWWGMALQELDLKIVHRAGKHNSNADALSCSPLPDANDDHPTEEVVAAVTWEAAKAAVSMMEESLGHQQRQDLELFPFIDFVVSGTGLFIMCAGA